MGKCLKPMHAIRNSWTTENGKQGLTIVSFADWSRRPDRYDTKKWIEIPCGQCIECRLNYSRDWATRMMCESQQHDESYFLTLTYDDEHLPVNDIGVPTFLEDDLKHFIKSLRNDGQKIRYYACSEYGERTGRPHFHAIVFGLHLDDIRLYRVTDGHELYNSEYLDKMWCRPIYKRDRVLNSDGTQAFWKKRVLNEDTGELELVETTPRFTKKCIQRKRLGHVVIAEVNFDTCAYVARYVTKKRTGQESYVYEEAGIFPERSYCSTHPGIGFNFAARNMSDILHSNRLILSTTAGGRVVPVPRYYKKILDRYMPESYAYVNELQTDQSIARADYLFSLSGVTDEIEKMYRDEASLKKRLSSLSRMLDEFE